VKPQPKEVGALGERLVSEALARLPSGYHHFDNLVVPDPRRSGITTQIDHVVASKCGVFVIETKKFQGEIAGEENDSYWVQLLGHKRFPFSNPLLQNRYHTEVLSRHLGLPWLAFEPVVVFVGLAQLLSPQLPPNVLTTIAVGVPGLRRFIDAFTADRLLDHELSAAVATLARLKNNGLTVQDHINSINSRDLERRLAAALQHWRKRRGATVALSPKAIALRAAPSFQVNEQRKQAI
jgi:hypothetical protein